MLFFASGKTLPVTLVGEIGGGTSVRPANSDFALIASTRLMIPLA